MKRSPTERELQILTLLANGRTVEEASLTLGIAKQEINEHVRHARRKLGARNRTHAVALAVTAGLVRAKRSAEPE
jgi:DNA-binding CsgD family transcriptional regulator